MSTRNHRNEKKKTSMTTPATISRSAAMNLIHEALSRVRMRMPQNASPEARRPARHIAMQARNQQDLELGNISQVGVP
jgi:hypothetical protein